MSRIVTCDVCGREELTDSTLLPDGWGVQWNYDWILCNKCQKRYKERFGKDLTYIMMGGSRQEELFEEIGEGYVKEIDDAQATDTTAEGKDKSTGGEEGK